MIQGLRQLENQEVNQELRKLANASWGLLSEISTDSSAITRDSLPQQYAQFYKNDSARRLFFNIDNEILSVSLLPAASSTSAASTSFYVGQFTRDSAVASGSQAVVGVGFTPKAIVFFATDDGNVGETSWGLADNNLNMFVLCDYSGIGVGDVYQKTTTKVVYDVEAAGKSYIGALASMDADGFTIDWVKGGLPVGAIATGFLAIG